VGHSENYPFILNTKHFKGTMATSEYTWAQEVWGSVLNYFDNDPYTVTVWGGFLLTTTFYWGMGSLFTFVDVTGRPKFMLKYKVQENVKGYPLSWEQLKDLVIVVVQNQLLVLLLLIGTTQLQMIRGTGAAVGVNELPSMWKLIGSLLFCQLVREVAFYYSHRLLHHPTFYKWIHKKHHTWTSPVAIAAAYCHPLEHIVSNILPIGLGPIFLRSHLVVLWIYSIYATTETLTVHSGFHLPLLKSPEFHDFHHLKFNYNYGVFGLMDWLHGTDSLFRTSKQFIRDKRLWGTTPIKALIP